MRWAINQISLAGGSRRAPDDLPRDLAAVRAGGWRAMELWLAHWDSYAKQHGLPAARRLLDDSGLTAAGGCGLGGLLFFRGEALHQCREELAWRLEQCQALGAPHFVVATTARLPEGGQLPEAPSLEVFEEAVENGRAAGELAARFGVRLGIEFLAGARFVTTLPAALALAERIDLPNVGVVVDTYHLYAGLSKTEDLELLRTRRDRLFFVHVSDVAASKLRELWTVPDRVLPDSHGAGGIPNRTLLDHIADLGYGGDVSLELFDAGFEAWWLESPTAAARAAYERCVALVPDARA